MLVQATTRRVAEFTRAATTPTYAAGQAVSNGSAMQFPAAIPQGCNGRISLVRVVKSGNTTTGATFTLVLLNADPGTETDASALALTYAQRTSLVGVFNFPAMVAAGSIAYAELLITSSNYPVPSGAPAVGAGTNLYGVLVAQGAYVGVSAESFSVAVSLEPES